MLQRIVLVVCALALGLTAIEAEAQVPLISVGTGPAGYGVNTLAPNDDGSSNGFQTSCR